MVSTLADGNTPTTLGHDTLRLQLIDQALERGIPWAVIGRALGGVTGPEAKKDARKLRTRVRQAALTAAPGEPGTAPRSPRR